MKFNHTPGPWEADYGFSLGHIKAINGKGKTPTICKYKYPCAAISLSEKETQANGILIAAAPKMLEFIVSIYQLSMGKIRSDARKIIEEATGKSIEEILEDEE